MTTDPAKRTDRTARKATAEQVMELSRNLPLTRSVPGRAVENATPGQLGFLSDLFRAENASRAEPRTEPTTQTGRIPPSQDPRRLRPGAWPRSPPTGDANSSRPSSPLDHAEDLVLHGRRGHARRTSLAIAIGTLACRRGIPVRFLRRLRPDHAAAQGQNRQQARPGTQDHRQGRPAHHRTGPDTCPSTSTAPGSCPRIIADSHGKEKHHPPPRTSSSADGATCSATATWPPPSSTASSTTAASSDSTANPTETPTHS